MNMRVKGKVAIVTGAAAGIGRATAYVLAREGASVVVAGHRREGAEKIAEDIKKSGGRALAVKTDISKEDEVNHMVDRAIDAFGRVDIMVNNAALTETPYKLFSETAAVEWKPQIDTTFIGTLLCCKAVIPHMLNQRSGRIINVTSDAHRLGVVRESIYAGCKAGIAGFSKAFAKEVFRHGITVNCVSPGIIKTEALARMFAQHPELEKKWTGPGQRMGEPEDMANMILFLASDEAKFITGQEYSVNGGTWV
jgi:NAD(P)-dependent dehydrogenase (short-subunit alcohol dehydrogenase family)